VFETIAQGVHRIEDAHVNWYLVEDGDALTVVDTGLPRSWGSLQAALHRLGRTAGEIDAVVLTHGHFDHVGFADRARRELGVGCGRRTSSSRWSPTRGTTTTRSRAWSTRCATPAST
jgi:glyoxylase-like metal-dependent hydrolase (beta-lactamase superfamily II)